MGGLAVPGHAFSAGLDDAPAGQQDTIPLLVQRRSAAFDVVVFAVIRRVVHEVNFQPRPVGEFDLPFQKLRPCAGVLRAVVEIDREPSDFGKLIADAGPPPLQTVAPEVARFVLAEDQRQRAGQQNQHAERNPFFFAGGS